MRWTDGRVEAAAAMQLGLIGIDGATHVREQQLGALAGGGCNQSLLETSASQSVVHSPLVIM